MIVVRIYKANPNDRATGSIQIYGYDGKKDGWFPANNFNFGFNAKQESEGNGAPPRGNTSASSSRPTAPAAQGAPADQKKKEDVFSAISISKEVDSATSYLMRLCMEERKSKKGVDSGILSDIHVLSSVDVPNQKRFIYPGLMVHLEGVRVEEWNIESSGDERPSETVQLRYDRAAMSYQRTTDGKNFSPAYSSGWDQTKNTSWTYEGFKEYIVTPTLTS